MIDLTSESSSYQAIIRLKGKMVPIKKRKKKKKKGKIVFKSKVEVLTKVPQLYNTKYLIIHNLLFTQT